MHRKMAILKECYSVLIVTTTMITVSILSNNHDNDNHEDDRTCPTQGLHKWVCHASSYSTKLDQEYYKYKYKYNTQPN